jgi:hypothetical protein
VSFFVALCFLYFSDCFRMKSVSYQRFFESIQALKIVANEKNTNFVLG